MLAQIPFWALFEQAGSSLNLFTDRLVDRSLFGWSVPAPVFQSLNAGFIFLFAPLMAWLWIALAKRKMEPSTPVKFAGGVFLVGLGFLSLVAGMNISGPAGLTAVGFIFLVYWVHTMGEAYGITCWPLRRHKDGAGAGGRPRHGGLVSLLRFVELSCGHHRSRHGAETIGGQLTDVAAAKATYAEVYTNVAYVAMAIAVGMLIISPLIKWLMRLDTIAEKNVGPQVAKGGIAAAE